MSNQPNNPLQNVTDVLDTFRTALERQWKRTEAAVNFAIKPSVPALGQTPKQVVWSKNKARLYRYHGEVAPTHAVPLLLVYALINKPYILDLTPGNSLVEYLVNQGYDVYMLDWGVPGEEDAGLTIEDYVLDYIPRAVKAVLKTSGQDKFSLLGYCQGGTLSACYAAAHPEAPLENLVLLTTPVDFADCGLYTSWLDPKHFNVDRITSVFPLIPSEMLQMGSKLLKPLQNYYGPYMTLFDRLDDPEFVEGWQVMDAWVNDGVPFAGAAYRQWVREFYQGNKLIKGELRLGGKPVKLSAIKANLLNVHAELDHIVTPNQALPCIEQVSSKDKTQLAVKAGHVGVVAGRSARKNFFPQLDGWLASRSN